MTLNDVPAVRETFAGFALEPVELSYTVGGNQAAKAVRELVITRRGQCAFDSRSGKPESPDCAVKNPKMRGALHTCLPMQRRVGVQGIDGSGGASPSLSPGGQIYVLRVVLRRLNKVNSDSAVYRNWHVVCGQALTEADIC